MLGSSLVGGSPIRLDGVMAPQSPIRIVRMALVGMLDIAVLAEPRIFFRGSATPIHTRRARARTRPLG